MQLRTAQRNQTKIKAGFFGTAGSGKTYSALLTAIGLVAEDIENPTPEEWSRVAIICTEMQDDVTTAADLYSDLGPFQVLPLQAKYTPERYINALDACNIPEIEVVIIDSISHEWEGAGGLLEIVNDFKNPYTAWNKAGKRHAQLVKEIIEYPKHLLVTGRTKTDYVMEETTNKQGNATTAPKKVGTKVVTREGLDYELSLSFQIDTNHFATCDKDRLLGLKPRLIDRDPFQITPETGLEIRTWCNSGAKVDDNVRLAKQLKDKMREYCKTMGLTNIDTIKTITGLDDFETQDIGELKSACICLSQEAIRRGLEEGPDDQPEPNEKAGHDDAGA